MISNEKLKERVINLMVELFSNYGTPDDKIQEVVMYKDNMPYKLFFVDTLKSSYYFVYNGVFDDFWVFQEKTEMPRFVDLFRNLS